MRERAPAKEFVVPRSPLRPGRAAEVAVRGRVVELQVEGLFRWRPVSSSVGDAGEDVGRPAERAAGLRIVCRHLLPHNSTPGFNQGNVNDKPRFIREAPYLIVDRNPHLPASTTRRALESLRSVDQGVKEIVDTLGALHRLQQHLRDLHLRQRLLLRRAPAQRRQVPRLRGLDAPALPDPQPGHSTGRPKRASSRRRRHRADGARTRPGRSGHAASTGARCTPTRTTPALRSRRPLLFESFVQTSDVEEDGGGATADRGPAPGGAGRRQPGVRDSSRNGAKASDRGTAKNYYGIRLGPYKSMRDGPTARKSCTTSPRIPCRSTTKPAGPQLFSDPGLPPQRTGASWRPASAKPASCPAPQIPPDHAGPAAQGQTRKGKGTARTRTGTGKAGKKGATTNSGGVLHAALRQRVETTQRKPMWPVEVSTASRLARGGAVAQAVVRRAEVRAALDHLARDVRRRAAARRSCRSAVTPRVARHATGWPPRPDAAARTSPRSTPRRCRPCREAVAVGRETCRPARCLRSRRAAGSARGTRPARCWPSAAVGVELVAPGVDARRRARRGRRTPTRPRSAAPCRPTRVGRRRPRRRHARPGWRSRPSSVAARALGRRQLAPGTYAHQSRKSRRSTGRGSAEDQRARDEQGGVGARVVGRVGRALGDGDIARRLHEARGTRAW